MMDSPRTTPGAPLHASIGSGRMISTTSEIGTAQIRAPARIAKVKFAPLFLIVLTSRLHARNVAARQKKGQHATCGHGILGPTKESLLLKGWQKRGKTLQDSSLTLCSTESVWQRHAALEIDN
jgi:hypothetical protein